MELNEAQNAKISAIIIPGTDITSSQKAVEIAHSRPGLYAAIGIHPHHAFEIDPEHADERINQLIADLTVMITDPAVVAVGEVGLDKHVYEQTKYADYAITSRFIEVQTALLQKQIELALLHRKSLILHNRETKKEILTLIDRLWKPALEHRSVFHCCEPDTDLLAFARAHHMYVGIDGDVTYGDKDDFIKRVPLEMLVLETDSPFLLPEPLKSQKKYPNGPKNIPLIAQAVAHLKGVSIEEVARITTQNAQELFQLPH
jgi:TatD DNase family protein